MDLMIVEVVGVLGGLRPRISVIANCQHCANQAFFCQLHLHIFLLCCCFHLVVSVHLSLSAGRRIRLRSPDALGKDVLISEFDHAWN